MDYQILRYIQEDDVSKIETYQRQYGTDDFINLSFNFEINGDSGLYTLDVYMVQYHAINCLRKWGPATNHEGHYTSLHHAFNLNWMEGIEFLMKYPSALKIFDQHRKTPLAIFADNQRPVFLPKIVQLLADNNCKDALKIVYKEGNHSYSFVQYLYKFKYYRLINSLDIFRAKKLISDSEIEKFKADSDLFMDDNNIIENTDPTFLKHNIKSIQYKRAKKAFSQIQPKLLKTKISPPFLSENSIEETQKFIHKINTYASKIRPTLSPVPKEISGMNVVEFLMKYTNNEINLVQYFITYQQLKEIYSAIELNSEERFGTIIRPNGDLQFWYNIGIILANIAVCGCSYVFEKKFDPLVFDCLIHPFDYPYISDDRLIDYLKSTKPADFREYTNLINTHKYIYMDDKNSCNEYNAKLLKKYKDDLLLQPTSPIYQILKAIKAGFTSYTKLVNVTSQRGLLFDNIMRLIINCKNMNVPQIWIDSIKKNDFPDSIVSHWIEKIEMTFVVTKNNTNYDIRMLEEKRNKLRNELLQLDTNDKDRKEVYDIIAAYGGATQLLPLSENTVKLAFRTTNNRLPPQIWPKMNMVILDMPESITQLPKDPEEFLYINEFGFDIKYEFMNGSF